MDWYLFWSVSALIWAICGFLAYGLTKGLIRELLDSEIVANLYADNTEAWPVTNWIWGPIGLFVAVSFALITGTWGFCLRLPRRLLEVHARLTAGLC